MDGKTVSDVNIGHGPDYLLEPDQNFSQFMNEKKMADQE